MRGFSQEHGGHEHSFTTKKSHSNMYENFLTAALVEETGKIYITDFEAKIFLKYTGWFNLSASITHVS